MLSSTCWHVLAESILLVALGQTIAFGEAKMLRLKANLLRAKALLPKVNLLLAKARLQKAALLDWSAPGLRLCIYLALHLYSHPRRAFMTCNEDIFTFTRKFGQANNSKCFYCLPHQTHKFLSHASYGM